MNWPKLKELTERFSIVVLAIKVVRFLIGLGIAIATFKPHEVMQFIKDAFNG